MKWDRLLTNRNDFESLDKKLCNIWRHLRKRSVAVYFLLGILWKILVGIITPDLTEQGINNSILKGASIRSFLLVALVMAPLIETLVFQVLPIEIFNRVTKRINKGKSCVLFSIVLSALIFGLAHHYSIEYIFFAFLLGLYLAFFYSYTYRVFGKNWMKGFASTALLHFVFNLLAACAVIVGNSFQDQSSKHIPVEQRDTTFDSGMYIGEHVAVDLGLSVKWASVNLGADFPEDSGYYLSWGQTSPASEDYYTAYSDFLSMEADGARQLWGNEWRIPTDAELTELRKECIWTWTEYNGKNGYRIQGPSGESIFLPAAGYKSSELFQFGEEGRYWSSQLKKDDALNVYMLGFDHTRTRRSTTNRSVLQTIRPVAP